MQIEEYLKEYQPVVHRIFENALLENKLSHAYLLSGSVGMPTKELAVYLAKSILCPNHNPFACNECPMCERVDSGNCLDLLVFDGKTTKIKKEDVSTITSTFDKTALEKNGKMVYVLHLVEMMTPAAVNSLLKFLEEPGSNVYAILTTENESKVLPTIISRTQVLKLKESERGKIIDDAVLLGVETSDAELLSSQYLDPNKIKEIADSDSYKDNKELVLGLLDALTKDKDEAIFYMENMIIPKFRDPAKTKLFIEMLTTFFLDLLNLSYGRDIFLLSYDTILNELVSKLNHIDKSLLVLLGAPDKLNINVNTGLLLDHIIYEIVKE